MKMYIVLAAVVAIAIAAPQHGGPSKDAQILKSEFDNIGVDGYKFAYETSDGSSRSETAEVKNPGSDHEALTIRGTISWTDLEGNKYTLNYVADENGFRPEGAHLPH